MEISLIEYKEHIKKKIDSLELIKLKTGVEEVKQLLNIMITLNEMQLLSNKAANTVKDKVEIKEEEKKEYPKDVFVFKKLLNGGTLLNKKDSFIPETIIRAMNLESGDLVRYDGKEVLEVLEKQKEEVEEDFILYRFCDVKKDDILLYCDESLYEGKTLIKLDEIPYKYVIPEAMIEKLKIEEGDFVDIGYEKNNKRHLKIVWRHDNEEHITPKPSSHYKEKTEKTLNAMFYGVDFQKEEILVVGCEPRKRHYKDAIEKCNGNFIFCSGDAQLDRIFSTCDKSSIVLILKDFLSHTVVNKTVDHCKEKHIPFKVVDGLGIKTIIFEARKLIASKEASATE